MKVLILSTSTEGGAGHSALRLHRGLKKIGVDSYMLVRSTTVEDANILIAPRTPAMKIYDEFARLVRAGTIDHLFLKLYRHREPKTFSIQWAPDGILHIIDRLRPDIIHLRWVCGGLLRIETIRKFQQPIVWTLSDMWPVTGGCHHSEECDHYTAQCGACPRLGSHRRFDLSHWVWRRKSVAYAKKQLTIVAPSTWIAERARKSTLFKNKHVVTIPHGLDTGTFQPVDCHLARKMLGLPQDRPLLLFGAGKPGHPWKGSDLLQAALQRLHQRNMLGEAELVVFGGALQNGKLTSVPKTYSLGHFHDDISLAMLYSAADVFIMPSRYESFGQMATEAMACGTPVVGFNAHSLPDLIDHRKTGYLAAAFDTEDLARGIHWVVEDKERQAALSRNAREKAERDFNLERYARRYASLFEEILHSPAAVAKQIFQEEKQAEAHENE